MKSAQEIIARMAAERGYMYAVSQVGAKAMDTKEGDLTLSQAELLDILANDPVMVFLNKMTFGRYEEIKIENPDVDAEPWY